MSTADALAQLALAQQALTVSTAADAAALVSAQSNLAAVQAASQATIDALNSQIAQLQAAPKPAPTVSGLVPVLIEDFTGPTVNPARFNVRNNDSGGNNYAFYTAANVTVQADGVHLTARRQTGLTGQPSSKPYTSGYLDTIGKCSVSVGRWEVVAKLPAAKGLWPAIWLRCDSTLGEVDIVEAVGGVNGDDVETVHQSTNGDMDKSGYEYRPSGLDLTQWHTYALERDADGTLRWYVDNVLTRTRRPTDLDNQHQPMTWLAGPQFASPLNLRINLQVGGSMPKSFGCDVDSTTVLPADMVIRAVRIYQRTN